MKKPRTTTNDRKLELKTQTVRQIGGRSIRAEDLAHVQGGIAGSSVPSSGE